MTNDHLTVSMDHPRDIHCHGDPAMYELRVARTCYDKTLAALTQAKAQVEKHRDRVGDGIIEFVLEQLDYGYLDRMDSRWFNSTASEIRSIVADAKEPHLSSCYLPNPITWPDLEHLASAMTHHARSITQLIQAEKLTHRHSFP